MMDGKVYVPPLKIRGIKTKLVPLIQQTAPLSRDTVWIEPFMGSGVVGFNVAPPKAVFSDTNPHIIQFYRQIQSKKLPRRSSGSFWSKRAPDYLRATGITIIWFGNGLTKLMSRWIFYS